jgi:hypothetical protein
MNKNESLYKMKIILDRLGYDVEEMSEKEISDFYEMERLESLAELALLTIVFIN